MKVWSTEEIVGVVLIDNRDEGELLSLKIRRSVAASVLLLRLLDSGVLTMTGL
jgi:predicted solute-binding protein